MHTTWDLKDLRDQIERLFGQMQREAISPSLNTIVERRTFARYHYGEAKRLLADAIAAHDDISLVGLILGAYDKEPGEFEWTRIQASAHINACVHSMHAIADILGQVIYLGLGMNRAPATELGTRHTTIFSVRDKLPPGAIRNLVSDLLDHPNFVYLCALNNNSKHRSIVSLPYSVDMTGEDEEGHGLKFAAFHYEYVDHASRWVRPFLQEEYQRQEGLIMQIGNALNEQLAASPTPVR